MKYSVSSSRGWEEENQYFEVYLFSVHLHSSYTCPWVKIYLKSLVSLWIFDAANIFLNMVEVFHPLTLNDLFVRKIEAIAISLWCVSNLQCCYNFFTAYIDWLMSPNKVFFLIVGTSLFLWAAYLIRLIFHGPC